MHRFDAKIDAVHAHRASVPLKRLRQWLWRLYWGVCLLLLIVLGWSLYYEYYKTLATAERSSQSLIRSLDEHLTRSFASVEQAMQNVAEDITRDGGVSHIDEKQIHETLREKVQLTPQVRGLIAIDEKGILRAHGLEYPTRQISLADRSYFAYHRDSPSLNPLLDTPLVSRTDYKWLIPVTRRITTKDGNFGGIVLAGVEPDYFLSFYQFLALDSGTHVQVTLDSGAIMLAYPSSTELMGKTARELDPHYAETQDQEGHLLRVKEGEQGKDRFVIQQHNAGHYPFQVRISMEADRVLAPFQENAIKYIMIVAFFIVLHSMLHYLLLRQLRRADEAESQLRLTQHTVDVSPDMVLWCKADLQLVYANKSVLDHTGYQIDDLLDKPIEQIVALDESSWQDWCDANPQGSCITHTAELTCADGNTTPIEITLSAVAFNGQSYLCVAARNISERKEAERELKRHRDHLQELVSAKTAEIQTILDASPLAIALSTNGQIKVCNRAFEALFTFRSGKIENMQESVFFLDETQYADTVRDIRERAAQDKTFRREIELKRNDGGRFWAVFFARAINPHAPEEGLIYVIEDNTPQRLAAQALRHSERLMRLVLDATEDSFALVDTHNSFIEINRALCLQTGISSSELKTKTPASLWGEAIAEKLFPHDPKQIAHQPFEEVSLPDQSGNERTYLASRGVVCDEDGQITHAFVFLTNITHQKEIERSLIQAKEYAERANTAKSLFLTNMSHELRTPMHAILSFSEMGIQKTDNTNTSTLKRYFERIDSSGRRLLKMLNDLLDMSKLEANKMQYNLAQHALQQTFQTSARELSSLLSNKNLRIEMDETTPTVNAYYDQERIHQVFINLLSNAIKFSPKNGAIHIQFLDEAIIGETTRAVGLAIRDEGPGVPEQDINNIFEAFIQGHQTLPQGGTGLGLAICRRIILDHNGQLWVENHPTGGAIFKLLLPVKSDETQARAAA
ncbi:PAS domain S-box protein [Uliginosibacterium gangwonense]|uniref:PAS domain S-box protein n=1 Tax=Uliginosibacterium gangwonense TaxID=392736 RepID=UPI000376549B|nr:PAS domain S-box protein [Uliginosibacterium gangwonense]